MEENKKLASEINHKIRIRKIKDIYKKESQQQVTKIPKEPKHVVIWLNVD